MREIVLDTETTGLDPVKGDRLVEIGCIEVFNTIPTGEKFHVYLNPERDMPDGAFNVHGLSEKFLADKPKFADAVDDFMQFIGTTRLVIHNAEFDMRFINSELQRAGRPIISMTQVLDTLTLARRKHPGLSNSLDALCTRYAIDNSHRTKHGALLDAEILAEVYAELTGGRQTALVLSTTRDETPAGGQAMTRQRGAPLPARLTPQERDAHAAFVTELGSKAIWSRYLHQDKTAG